jgi:phenylacetate-coenzyme A ligase PaaK-like adenylate-forming protein
MTARSPERVPAAPVHPPAFFDTGQSVSAAWDVWWSLHAGRARVEQLAQARLTELIGFARQHSAFYRHLYRRLPADERNLSRLPSTTKGELMAHFEASLTDPEVTRAMTHRFVADASRVGQPLLGRYAVWTSSGTTGEPGIFVHDGNALAVYDALEVVRFRRLGSPLALAAAYLASDRYALLAATGGHFAGHAVLERLRALSPWLGERARVFSILESTPKITAQLNEYQPTLLATYPTAASLLAEEQQAGRLAIRPREIWTGGERLSGAQRSLLVRVFGAEVRDGYGASEFLAMAWDCGYGALHVNADWIVLEPVDRDGRPVPPGVASHTVLLTNLANRVQPLIRYDLGDSVTLLDRPCPCGSTFPAIRVEGRCDDVVGVRAASGNLVKLLPLALTTVLEDEAGVHRFQVVQASATELILRLDPERVGVGAEQRCRESLRRFLDAQGVPNVGIRVERRDLQRHPVSGKLRRIIAVADAGLAEKPGAPLSAGTADTG